MNKRLNLLQAVLASSCLMVPFAGHAAFTVNAIINDLTVVTDADDATNTITATGQINESTAAPGIDVLHKNNTINIETVDPAFPAIVTTGGNDAIRVNMAGSNLTVNNQVNRTINSNSDGLITAADLTTLNNDGTITTIDEVVQTSAATGTNLTVNNSATGILSSTGVGGNAIESSAANTTINNSGRIASSMADAVNANAAATNLTINNTATGLLVADTGSAISVTGAVGGNGVTITNAGSDPTNMAQAGIGSTNSAVPAIDITNSKLNSLINTGDIGNLKVGGGGAINLDNVTGTTFTNSGEIYNNSATGTIVFNNGTTLTNGFVNTGTIENEGAGAAINYVGANGVTFFQQAGTVTGDVQLQHSVPFGVAMNMTEGTIDGNVTMDATAGFTLLELNGGTITGKTSVQNGIGGITLNGSSVQAIEGDGNALFINLTSGSYASIDGMGGANVLNVLGSFDTTGTIDNMDTTNVNAGPFNVNHTMSNIDTALNVNATMNVNANIAGAGTFTNNGTTKISSGSTVTMGGLVTNTGTLRVESGAATPLTGVGFTNTGNLVVDLKPSAASPSMNTGAASAVQAGAGAVNLAGGTITGNPVGEYIANGSKWDIISSTGGFAGAPTVTTPSVLLSFAEEGAPLANTYQITATTVPFASLSGNSEITNGLENALDTIINDGPPFDPAISALLGQFQTLTSAEQVEQALRTLVPNFNHSISTMSSFSVRRAFDDIGMRLEELQAIRPLLEEVDEYRNNEDLDGWSYGDPLLRHKSGAWLRPYAGFVDQQALEGVDGYKGDYTGITGGMDWRILDWATVGIAGSFAKTDITQRGTIDVKQDIDSLQLTFYGQFDPYGPMYFNTLFGLTRHKYGIDRTISVGTLVQKPQANYHAIQYAGKLEMGYAYFNGKYYVNPLASLKYMRLVADGYTETGAPLGLSVDNNDVSEFVGAVGLRLAMQNEYLEATYIPEITGLISYDFIGDSQETFNNFAVGSPTFKSIGIKPDQTSYILNLGLRIHTFHNSMFKIAYEFEAKDQYKAHSAMFKWYYKWY